jgi:hypothetical protein
LAYCILIIVLDNYIRLQVVTVLLLLRIKPSKEETSKPMKAECRLSQEENTGGKNKMM